MSWMLNNLSISSSIHPCSHCGQFCSAGTPSNDYFSSDHLASLPSSPCNDLLIRRIIRRSDRVHWADTVSVYWGTVHCFPHPLYPRPTLGIIWGVSYLSLFSLSYGMIWLKRQIFDRLMTVFASFSLKIKYLNSISNTWLIGEVIIISWHTF